jgi:hypothetical protein
MAKKIIYLASTDTPFTDYRGSAEGQARAASQLKSAWEKGVPITFSTDMDYWNERMKKPNGEWMSRGDLTINFLLTWKAAGTLPAGCSVEGDARSKLDVGECQRRSHLARRVLRPGERARRSAPFAWFPSIC